MAEEKPEILVFGTGGFGREVAWLAEACGYDFVAFVDDARHGEEVNGAPVLTIDAARDRHPAAAVVVGIGSPHTRETLAATAARAGFRFATLFHPRAERSRFITIGEGSVVCAGNILTTNIALGRQVQVNLACTIGHDVVIGDFATLAPGVHVSGQVHIGKRAYVGTGAVILNGTRDQPLTIGDDAVIGAAACVTKPVAAGVTVVGVPARGR